MLAEAFVALEAFSLPEQCLQADRIESSIRLLTCFQ